MARPLKHPQARARILDAADLLLATRGYARMTVDSLAEEAGIGKGTVYLFFGGKQAVALACLDRMSDRLLDALRALAAGRGAAPARLRAMLRHRVLARFDYAASHSASLDALLAAFRAAFLERRARHFAAEAGVLAQVLREGAAAGTLRAHDARAAAAALVDATNALLPYSLSVRELGQRRDVERRVTRLSNLVVQGLVSNPPASRRNGHRRPHS